MGSISDSLRKMVGLPPKPPKPKPVKAKRGVGVFNELSAKFFACEDADEKEVLWQQMCKALPDTLFLAAMCYEGEDPNAAVQDRSLHATVGSKRLYSVNESIVTHGNPGYRLAKKNDSRRIHLRTIVYNKTKEEWVPLFTDFTKLLPVFGQNSRVTIISYAEAKQIAKPYKGLVINPGKEAIRLGEDELKKA